MFLSFLEGGGQSAKVPALNIISSLSLSLKRYTRIMQSLVQLGGFIITILLLHHCDTIIVRIVIPHGQLIAPLWLAGALLCSQSAVRSGKRSGWNSGEVACCCIITSGSLCVKTGELQSHAGLYTKPPLLVTLPTCDKYEITRNRPKQADWSETRRFKVPKL